ncbi:MAG: NADAR family protein [Patescibacteria group bacterium]
MYPSSSAGLNRETDEQVFFFTTAFYPLDNYSAHSINIWNKTFPTAEHAYHWKKFELEEDISEKIYHAQSPEIAKQIAGENKNIIEKRWHDIKRSVMKEILTAKMRQHNDVREVLQRSSGRELIENSPVDSYWGCGKDGNGRNEVGKIWMEIRKDEGII